VLKQHEVNGDVQALDPAAAAKLKKQATEILGIATGGKNK
jgi:putative lipoprotein